MAFLQEGRVRELAEGIRARCVQAHQLKMAGQQQSTTTANIQVGPPGCREHVTMAVAAAAQVSLAEDMQKRLRQAVQTLQEAIRGGCLSSDATLPSPLPCRLDPGWCAAEASGGRSQAGPKV